MSINWLRRLFSGPSGSTSRRARLHLEHLESRYAPATLLSTTQVSYQDAECDAVTLALSKPILNATTLNTIFTFNMGMVNGSNAAKQQLKRIDLSGMGPDAVGTKITTKAVKSPMNGGDGFAHTGEI